MEAEPEREREGLERPAPHAGASHACNQHIGFGKSVSSPFVRQVSIFDTRLRRATKHTQNFLASSGNINGISLTGSMCFLFESMSRALVHSPVLRMLKLLRGKRSEASASLPSSLGPSCAHHTLFGPSWPHLGSIWAASRPHDGPILGYLGLIGPCWARHMHFLAYLGLLVASS